MTTLPYNTQDLLNKSKELLAGSSYDQSLTTTPAANNGSPVTSNAGGLMDFKNVLSQAVQLAKEHRNALDLGFMAGAAPVGTMAASDFGSILSNMNAASDKTTETLVKNMTPTYKTEQIGSDLYQYQVDGTGRIIGEPVKILSGSTGEDEYKNYNAKQNEEQKRAKKKISKYFETAQRDQDGYPTPEEFRNARAAWVADDQDGSEFDQIYSGYVNPKKAAEYGVNFQTKISSNNSNQELVDLINQTFPEGK